MATMPATLVLSNDFISQFILIRDFSVDKKNTVNFDAPSDILDSPECFMLWNELALSSDNLYAFYQSPIWWEYSIKVALRDHILRLRYGGEPVVANVFDQNGDLAGMFGLFEKKYQLHFRISNRILASFSSPVVQVMGGQPLIRGDANLYVEFIKSVFKKYPDCNAIHIPWVPIGSDCWNVLHESIELRSFAKIYIPDRDLAKHYCVKLGPTFDAYLNKFNKKSRYNLRREINKLKDYSCGQLDIVRIERAEDVRYFLDAAAEVSLKSWQNTLEQQMDNSDEECARYTKLADLGVLRCYIMIKGEAPLAFVRGFQYGNTFYYSRVAFDKQFKEFSPGKILFYLMLEDLHFYRKPNLLNFQEGEYEYKRRFANDCFYKTDVLLVRNDAGAKAKLLVLMHKIFNYSVVVVRRFIKEPFGD